MRQFQRTGVVHPGSSVFDLSYRKKFTCDMGQLIPVMCDEMVPGDVFKVSTQVAARFQPMVAPIMHDVNIFVHYFFVPYRLLWSDWEKFITGGEDGQFAEAIPLWGDGAPVDNTLGSLWDFLGMPVGVNPVGAYPIAFPQYAYNFIYNEYYRDETLITKVALTNGSILNRCWEKDYFTSALPWQQRGTAPALPISGLTSAVWPSGWDAPLTWPTVTTSGAVSMVRSSGDSHPGDAGTKQTLEQGSAGILITPLNDNVVDLSTATTFNVADLRLAFQIQRWLERNARAGARYVEFLNAHFGVNPRDDRLQRPEYVGGSRTPMVISEVLKTSTTDTTSPQANMAGHGIAVDHAFAGVYRAQEFGLMMGIMSIMPRSAYQQGINRQWLRRTKYDFYFPEFANLSEQPILRAELYADGDSGHNNTVFGFQGRYDEMRVKMDMVCSEMRSTFDYWHLGRIFGSAPLLNEAFVKCVPDKRVFAVENVPGVICQVGNIIRATRPMPIMSQPGLIDHD